MSALEPRYPRPRNSYKHRMQSTEPTPPGTSEERAWVPQGQSLLAHPLNQKLRPLSLRAASLLLLLCTIASIKSWSAPNHLEWAANRLLSIEQGQYWRLFTSLLIHADLGHLLANSGLFLIFGLYLRNYFGPLAFPILPLLGGMLASFLTLNTYASDRYLIGASGMVYFMVGLWIALFFRYADYLSRNQRLMRGLAFVLVVLVPTELQPEVSYRAHAIGFALGLGPGLLLGPWLKPLTSSSAPLLSSESRARLHQIDLQWEEDLLP